jgi:LysM repeat protein
LSHIANRYDVSIAQLERANPGLDARRLRVGQRVQIPGGSAATTSASSTRDALSASSAKPTARTHVIRRGDTLDAIARRYGVTVRGLQQANPGLSARRLIPGRSIRIP